MHSLPLQDIDQLYNTANKYIRLASRCFIGVNQSSNKAARLPLSITEAMTAKEDKPISDKSITSETMGTSQCPINARSPSERITPQMKRSLESIKAPVILYRRNDIQKSIRLSDADQERSVKQMEQYIFSLPKQEPFLPPQIPMITLADPNIYEAGESYSVHDYQYLSSERDVALWHTIQSSPGNCNIFVRNLSVQVTKDILWEAFKPFDSKNAAITVNIIRNPSTKLPRGFGFVIFTNRRSAEEAMICMQDFELFGRNMQLGWGKSFLDQQPVTKAKTGDIDLDTVSIQESNTDLIYNAADKPKRKRSRWDVVNCSNDPKSKPNTQITLKSSSINSADLIERLKKASNSLVWLTKQQLKLVCKELRNTGVTGHIGVFGMYYEPDNRRLYVRYSVNVNMATLMLIFAKYGSAKVKANEKKQGRATGSAFVQYDNAESALKAMNELNGEEVGGLPLQLAIAEPAHSRKVLNS
ncbi:uncharacterized protein TRIADDRAFT_52757 [Trichoplax adhaerens]|uniref:RRM domain-containing protein n=1 Tax=Trichoplax adhaerens TaxID=10228 RepID=B3RK90_TRIAD|nr:hypothetical protein TRIADDRAFT_52757 [Trichoplax adhaerens]EDV29885.1 hypothetical protein TRIADDRAFT_52757 [Trichoplax adhaerens]|eukprot:XP_002109087.1 hypothetical protein TRIADDRAFT_52757 [Trichoplax adhaerens]